MTPTISYTDLIQPRPEEKQDHWQRWQAQLRSCGIPDRFAAATLDRFVARSAEQQEALAICRRYVDHWDAMRQRGTGLVLCGGVGTGKTHVSCAIASRLLARGVRIRRCTVPEFLRDIRDTWRRDSAESTSEALQRYIDPDLLVLDEVGLHRGTEDVLLQLFELIDARYNAVRPTILVSNLTVDELVEFVGERVIDRLREGGGKVVVFDWESYRA